MYINSNQRFFYSKQQHIQICQLGHLVYDFMFVRYGKGHTSEAYQKKLIRFYNSIGFRFYSLPKENLDIDIHNIYYIIGCYAHLWFTHEIDFNSFSQLFYHYFISKNHLSEKNVQSRVQLMTELGCTIGLAPKELFKPLGFFETENSRREKIKKHFMPLLKLISLTPNWNEVLNKDPKQEYEKSRDKFVGDQEDQSLKEAEVNGTVSAKAKALIDFVDKKLDFKDMMKAIEFSDEINGKVNLPVNGLDLRKQSEGIKIRF